MRSILPALLICFMAASARAANHYVRAGARGNGTDWTNAYSKFPDKLTRGDTYYVADGKYSGYTFDDPLQGEKYINIHKATGKDHGSPTGWKAAYGDGVARFGPILFMKGYYRFDGRVGGGPRSWISGHGFEVANPKGGVLIRILDWRKADISHIEIRHVNVKGAGPDVPSRGILGTTGNYTHITISYCYLHDFFGVPFYFIRWKHCLVEYNFVARNKSTPKFHSEGVSSWVCSYLVYRYNWWEDIEGTGGIQHMGGNVSNFEFYGNVFNQTANPDCSGVAHGTIADNFKDSIQHVKIYNNTIVGIKGICSGFRFFHGAGDIEAANNLWVDCPAKAFMQKVKLDHNTYVNTLPPREKGTNDRVVKQAKVLRSVAKRDFNLRRATAPGRALPAPYNRDMLGRLRGKDGVWDRGAYEFGSLPKPTGEKPASHAAPRENKVNRK